ncbi:MAG: type II secretion system protein M [Rhodoferax sp.]|nr:type II secretion system protein M [Rhodoferax sp.]
MGSDWRATAWYSNRKRANHELFIVSSSSSVPSETQTLFATLHTHWRALAPRERHMLGLAATLVLGALLWVALLGPALRTLRSAQTQASALDLQIQQMTMLQIQAQGLQKQAPLGYEEALRALTQATEQTLGKSAQLKPSAERATVTLQAAPADAVASWLAQARLNARSTPMEVHLTRQGMPTGASTWSGVLVMALPQR